MTTSLADQDTTQLGGRLSVLARQKADHVRLDRLLRGLEETDGVAQDAVLDAAARHVPGTASTGLVSGSRALARVAGHVERAGPLRRGEDPSTHRG